MHNDGIMCIFKFHYHFSDEVDFCGSFFMGWLRLCKSESHEQSKNYIKDIQVAGPFSTKLHTIYFILVLRIRTPISLQIYYLRLTCLQCFFIFHLLYY